MFNAFSASDPRWIVLVAFSAGVCPCPAVVAKISENKTAAGKPQRAEDFKDMATGLRRGEGKAVFFSLVAEDCSFTRRGQTITRAAASIAGSRRPAGSGWDGSTPRPCPAATGRGPSDR